MVDALAAEIPEPGNDFGQGVVAGKDTVFLQVDAVGCRDRGVEWFAQKAAPDLRFADAPVSQEENLNGAVGSFTGPQILLPRPNAGKRIDVIAILGAKLVGCADQFIGVDFDRPNPGGERLRGWRAIDFDAQQPSLSQGTKGGQRLQILHLSAITQVERLQTGEGGQWLQTG